MIAYSFQLQKYEKLRINGYLCSMETIVLEHLTIGYKAKAVATDLQATLQAGEFTCLLGPNGVGKSTLLRTLSGFLQPLKGCVRLNNKDISTLKPHERSRQISVVLTTKVDAENITVTELVSMGRYPYTGFFGNLNDADCQIVDEAMAMVGITPLKSRLIHTLSDGERQKTMIAKALAQQTPVIYLDEPTAFLDFPSKVGMMQLLRRLAHELNKTILLSTHDIEQALQVADRLWLLDNGRLHVGTPRELAEEGTLGHFIEQGKITFDTEHMRINIG